MERMASPEVVAKANPDVILMTEFGYDRLGGSLDQIKALPGVATSNAAKNNRIYRVEEHDLMYFNPDTGANVAKLATLIHAGASQKRKDGRSGAAAPASCSRRSPPPCRRGAGLDPLRRARLLLAGDGVGHRGAALRPAGATLDERIFSELRVPRALLCLFVGASLGVGGTLMQALFRNPIVEPGLVGTSSGAAFGAALFFVLGSALDLGASPWALPLAACVGGVLATGLVFALAQGGRRGRPGARS